MHMGSVPDHGQGVHLFERLVMCFLVLSGTKMIYEMKLIHVRSLDFLHHTAKVIKDLDAKQMQDALVYEAIFQAVDQGNVEFITAICKANPELMWSTDEEKRTLFHLAIKCRQESVYSLIYGLSMRHALPNLVDKYNNNLLHMAAMVSPLKRLNDIPGAALQMQRELQWFKGEKWMKDTANSCTVLGALVITIVFAAAITVPDALSFFFSTTSLLTFWGIVTSRYAEDDFLKSLPTKMTIGLASLLYSINTMMIAFCSAILIMFNENTWMSVPIMLLASIPVTLSVWMLFPLFVQMFIFTFGRGIFDRKFKFRY
ncbi:putative ankyrin repeat-containing domain, PGG domain-containing protein [Rosa chinensis]|uniref:Putative ankyrin repeat-containing domain, PGG domain-containing protein n=1 Tax=Rosa chinensis TaxID=74649 RepID=A0A2P6SE84_ROSCH|nr:putative ankyrin repeat-containing domain, PGG domain-containing protein [Rosa chinensis]